MVSGPLAFSVTGLVLVAIIGGVLYAATQRADDPAQPSEGDPGHAGAAQVLADAFVGPGTGWGGTGPPDWDGDGVGGEATGRLGLGDDATAGALDADKLRSLLEGRLEADTLDRVDYDEARTALGMDALGLGFRLRLVPALPAYSPSDPPHSADVVGPVAYLAASCAPTPIAPTPLQEIHVVEAFADLPGVAGSSCVVVPPMGPCPTLTSYEVVWIASQFDASGMCPSLSSDLEAFVEQGNLLVVAGSLQQSVATLSDFAPNPLPPFLPRWRPDDAVAQAAVLPNALPAIDAFGAEVVPVALEDHFETVALDGATPVVRVSKQGAFDDGTVVALSVDVQALVASDPDAAHRLVQNTLALRHRELALQYGGSLPGGSAATPAERIVYVDAPAPMESWAGNLGRCGTSPTTACIEVRMYVWVFDDPS